MYHTLSTVSYSLDGAHEFSENVGLVQGSDDLVRCFLCLCTEHVFYINGDFLATLRAEV